MLLFILAAFDLATWLFLGTYWALGMRRLTVLGADAPEREGLPSLSVVIPARNEERTIVAGLTSVLGQDYPNLQVIVVDDRSTDRTGEVLEHMKARCEGLQVVHLEHLPQGWLGKNHALYTGAQRATGEWLLFTDADVEYAPGALKKLVSYALSRNLDHLAALPDLSAETIWLNSFVTSFVLLFSLATRPWLAANPRSRAYNGIGAFGLLRRSVYEAVGTHRAIALRPDDDVKLGKCVKKAGFKQEAVFAPELLRVEWYSSLLEAIHGLNKNAFAGFEYSLPVLGCTMGVLLLTNVLPFVAVLFTSGLTRLLFALVILVIFAVYAVGKRFSGRSWAYALLHPYGVTLLVYAALASAFTALSRGAISWRGTSYALEVLRKNRV